MKKSNKQLESDVSQQGNVYSSSSTQELLQPTNGSYITNKNGEKKGRHCLIEIKKKKSNETCYKKDL